VRVRVRMIVNNITMEMGGRFIQIKLYEVKATVINDELKSKE
jgi:hypothetical protein